MSMEITVMGPFTSALAWIEKAPVLLKTKNCKLLKMNTHIQLKMSVGGDVTPY